MRVDGVEVGDLIDHVEARRLATQHGWREKVVTYITRRPHELLILEHSAEYPTAGIQVPAGGVDAGELPADAAIREAREETGLTLAKPVLLESRLWPTDAPSKIRHYFWLTAPGATADTWTHTAVSDDDDNGMEFTLSFVPIRSCSLIPGYGFESALPALERLLAQ